MRAVRRWRPPEASPRSASVQLGAHDLAVIGGVGPKAIGAAARSCHRADDVVAVNVVRPDDDTFAEALPKVGDQVGEGVTSEVSSEVKPHAVNLEFDGPPGRAAQGASVVATHFCAPAWANVHRPSIIRRA